MKNLTMSVGRDHNYPLHGRYSYVVFLGEIVVLRETGFRSKRAAEKAGRAKAALEFNPPADGEMTMTHREFVKEARKAGVSLHFCMTHTREQIAAEMARIQSNNKKETDK